jgi:hypothetical protein
VALQVSYKRSPEQVSRPGPRSGGAGKALYREGTPFRKHFSKRYCLLFWMVHWRVGGRRPLLSFNHAKPAPNQPCTIRFGWSRGRRPEAREHASVRSCRWTEIRLPGPGGSAGSAAARNILGVEIALHQPGLHPGAPPIGIRAPGQEFRESEMGILEASALEINRDGCPGASLSTRPAPGLSPSGAGPASTPGAGRPISPRTRSTAASFSIESAR